MTFIPFNIQLKTQINSGQKICLDTRPKLHLDMAIGKKQTIIIVWGFAVGLFCLIFFYNQRASHVYTQVYPARCDTGLNYSIISVKNVLKNKLNRFVKHACECGNQSEYNGTHHAFHTCLDRYSITPQLSEAIWD
jgi:hypothetical protein